MSQAIAFDLVVSKDRDRTMPTVWAVLGGSLLLALSAKVALHLPMTPVPLTLQTLMLMLLAFAMGARRSAASAALYAVWAVTIPGFSASASVALTAGYLVGFVPAAWLAGRFFASGQGRSMVSAIITMAVAQSVIFVVAVPWLAAVTGLGFARALEIGCLPFVGVEVVKIIVAAALMRGSSAGIDRLVSRRR